MTILDALLPVYVTVLLGYLAAWGYDKGGKTGTGLNQIVMKITLPLDLFAGTVAISRQQLFADLPLLAALFVGLIVPFGVSFAVARYAFKRRLGESTLQALAISFPTVPAIGPALLQSLFGAKAATITIAMCGMAPNLLMVPISIVLLSLAAAQGEGEKEDQNQSASSSQKGNDNDAKNKDDSSEAENKNNGDGKNKKDSNTEEQGKDKDKPNIGRLILSALKEPVVWAPVLAVLFVLFGIRVPKAVVNSLQLLGATTGGISLFASGIILRAQRPAISMPILATTLGKLVVVPGLALVLLPLCGIVGKTRSEAVVSLAMPCVVMLVILSTRYRIAERESASALLVSYAFSAGTMPLAVLLAGK